MNAILKTFFDKLTERIFSLIGSSIGTTASTFHTIHRVEQLSLLEDLARRYESEGKAELATQLRHQAKAISADDPTCVGKEILRLVCDEPQLLPQPEIAAHGKPADPLPARTRRARKNTFPPLEADLSVDDSQQEQV